MRFIRERTFRVIAIIFASILIIAGGLVISGALTEPDGHIAPDYPEINIEQILSKKQLTEEDYKTLFYQTGLGKPSIDELRTESANSALAILSFQENFFKDINYVCVSNSPISKEESVVDDNGNLTYGTELAPLHNGYILITKSSHVFGWRNGHAALIVDASKGETLESVVLGTNSLVQQTDKWKKYPNFMIFRIKGTSEEMMNEISQSAIINLNNIPYDLTVGIFSPKYKKVGEITGTQCSHLVWEAFKLFGFDLDSDSGKIVTPKDIANSPLLEVVQVYGVNPEEIWS